MLLGHMLESVMDRLESQSHYDTWTKRPPG